MALDLVSVPQAMYCPAAGRRHGGGAASPVTSLTGLQLGVLLELFALDVLPVGAARYPDHGRRPSPRSRRPPVLRWPERMGMAVLLAMLLAVLGGWSLQRLRHLNAQALHGRRGGARGRQRARRSARCNGAASGATRSAELLLTALGLAGARCCSARSRRVDPRLQALLAAAAIGCALAAVAGGAARSAGRGPRLRWLVAGLAVGLGPRAGTRMNAAGRMRAFLRLFAMQGDWNYERMLGVGMGYAAEPLLEELRTSDPVAAHRGGGALGGVLQLQPEPRGPGARRRWPGPSGMACRASR